MRKLDRAPSGIKISGEVIGDTAGMIADYDRAKTAPITGNFCGLRQLDMTIGGSKNKELWVHAAYSGHLKSTFALNWAYHLAIFYQTSSVFFSLEMNYEQVRRQLATMHSFHFKFRDVRARLGLQNEQTGDVGLDYAKVRKGTLPPKEEEFYRNYVVPDLDDERNGYGRIHVEVRDPNQTQYTLEDMQEAAERIYEQDPFRKVFVDHSLLLDSRERRINTSDRVAEVLKDLKNLARGFRGGAGTDITVLHQINRPGYADALRKKEQGLLPRYNPTNLSQSSGTEQNADVITTSWIDEDLRRKHHILFDCLKAREDDLVPPFLANVRWPCPRVVTCAEQITVVPASGTTAAKRRAPKIVGTEVFNILGAQTTPAQA